MSKEAGMEIIDPCSSKRLAELYLRFGSVEEALKKYPELPISVPDFHRKIRKYGIVKGVGRQTVSLAELLYFFALKVGEPNISIERLYRLMPWVIRENTSMSTVHRIYQKVCERMVRTYAAALVLTEEGTNRILVADEQTQNISTGKIKGSTSLLMSYGVKGEPFSDSVLRVLQREFSTKLTLDGKLTRDGETTKEILHDDIKPFMYLHLLDVEVAVFNVTLPPSICESLSSVASSFKMANYRFLDSDEILSNKNNIDFRHGVAEMVEGYKEFKFGFPNSIPLVINANLNEAMLAFEKLK